MYVKKVGMNWPLRNLGWKMEGCSCSTMEIAGKASQEKCWRKTRTNVKMK